MFGSWPGKTVAALLAGMVLTGCATGPRNAVPETLVEQANVAGMTRIRFWGDAPVRELDAMIREKERQMRRSRPHLFKPGAVPRFDFLAVSGGGGDGAFGAGLLVGWSARGTRPDFEVVTGVSTGALIAPFAFLGKRYDPVLKEIYTTYTTRDLIRKQPIRGLLGGDSVGSNAPLQNLIARHVTRDFMGEIAARHRTGRRLLVGTANLDAQRPVIWDMGQIAASGHPDSLALFRKILVASAAVPVAFPPVHIKVDADGQRFEEMHVDGGTTNQVFLFPSRMMLPSVDKRIKLEAHRRVYVIRNGRLAPEWKPIQASAASIAARSVSTLIKNQGIGDLYRLNEYSKRNGMEFRLAYIPRDFKDTSTEIFDRTYMTALFDLAYRLGRQGYRWQKTPIGVRRTSTGR